MSKRGHPSDPEMGQRTGGLRGVPTRFDPVTVHLPWRPDSERLRAIKDPLSGDRTRGAMTRARNRPPPTRPMCVGCARKVKIKTPEELDLPICSTCASKGDVFLMGIAKKLSALQEEARLMLSEDESPA